MGNRRNSNSLKTFSETTSRWTHISRIYKKETIFHSLLQRDAPQAFCNIEYYEKDSLDETMTIFKRRFGDYLSMAKARCEWDALKIHSSTKSFYEFLDLLQKTAREAFGSEARSRNYSTEHTSRTSRIMTSYSTWREK